MASELFIEDDGFRYSCASITDDSDSDLDDEEREEWRVYSRSLEASNGFNVIPLKCPLCNVVEPFKPEVHSKVIGKDLDDCAQFAIAWFNERTTDEYGKLELVRVIKANFTGPAIWFYITLEARNMKSGEVSVFETRVFRRVHGDDSISVRIFWPKRNEY